MLTVLGGKSVGFCVVIGIGLTVLAAAELTYSLIGAGGLAATVLIGTELCSATLYRTELVMLIFIKRPILRRNVRSGSSFASAEVTFTVARGIVGMVTRS
jgi:hypothetical protein